MHEQHHKSLSSHIGRNLLYPLGVTGLAIYMYWHYSRGLRRNGSLYLIGVNITCSRVYIHKYRLYTIPPQSVVVATKL